jgi:DNA invertase Pin-like site-specific DNA recombinase
MTAMNEIGIPTKNIFIEKASGKDFKRSGYMRMVRKLKSDDEVFIKSIDRLSRNYDEIIEQWRKLTKEKEVNVIALDFPLLDTRHQGRFDRKVYRRFGVTDMSYVAQIERENTHARQMEGIREAKKKGVRFGRPKRKIPENFEAIANQCRLC